jgi:hypothetical protein
MTGSIPQVHHEGSTLIFLRNFHLARRDQLPLCAPASETSDARNPMISLAAGARHVRNRQFLSIRFCSEWMVRLLLFPQQGSKSNTHQ